MAGPNGSGKSTLVQSGTLGRHVGALPKLYLNPDDIVLEIRQWAQSGSELEILRQAQDRSDSLVDRAIREGTDFAVETVLSSGKFRPKVATAIAAGFRFGFVFVTLQSGHLNIGRVAQRVALGGHDVPTGRILARRQRAHAAFGWFALQAHFGLLFDNSVQPVLVAEKPLTAAAWTIHLPSLHPDLTGQL